MTSLSAVPPEAAGSGSYAPDGTVTYGDAALPGARVHIDPPVPPGQREADRAAHTSRCDRCAALPDDLVASLTAALKPKAGLR